MARAAHDSITISKEIEKPECLHHNEIHDTYSHNINTHESKQIKDSRSNSFKEMKESVESDKQKEKEK